MTTAKKMASDSKQASQVERTKLYLEELKKAGGKRSSYNFKPEVVEAIRALKAARPFDSETIVVGDALIEAASKLKKKK
jgi:hypothetical protein